MTMTKTQTTYKCDVCGTEEPATHDRIYGMPSRPPVGWWLVTSYLEPSTDFTKATTRSEHFCSTACLRSFLERSA